MTTEQKQRAGVYGFGDEFFRAQEGYDAWKHNVIEFYDRKHTGNKPVMRKGRLYLSPSNKVSVP
jgi:hypothetical protein